MTLEDAAETVLSEKSRASLRVATLIAIVGGAVMSTWYVASAKNQIEAAMRANSVKIAAMEKSLDRMATQVTHRYTASDAVKDWKSQTIINEKITNGIDDLRARMFELEKAVQNLRAPAR